MAPLPPLSLYVHLPWCVKKCPYCDFNSYSGGENAPRERYVDALIDDLVREARTAEGRELTSIFFGGGTPSLFAPDEIGRVLEEVMKRYAVEDDVEITMEANPGTIECGDLGGYRSAGVNRLSIGAQSFDAGQLSTLGRIHTVEDIDRSCEEARAAGFSNVNLDLMYALPGQSVDDAMTDIRRAAALRPAHISWYHLTLEPNTVFHARPPAGLPDDDRAASIQQAGELLLTELGYEHYEVSAYAREGRRCRHNLNYWSFGDYLGVGAGAHGKVTSTDAVARYTKPANPQQYMASMEAGGETGTRVELSQSDLLFEFMLNALRLTTGFEERMFTERTGLPTVLLNQRLGPLRDRGLVEEAGDRRWRPTQLGQRFLNDLQAHFLPE